jgi:hypothetical protein
VKLGEALSRLKKEKSRLARLIHLRKDNIYIEKGKKSKFNPKELSKEIDKKIEEIRALKIKIQKTNLHKKVAGENMLIAEAIIKVNDVRSKLAHLTTLFEEKKDYFFRDKEQKEKIAQLDELEIEDEIERLEIEKSQLDNKLQIANWTTTLED